MYFDTSHNSQRTMFSNIYSAFLETATKSWAYIRCLPKEKRPSAQLITSELAHDISHTRFLTGPAGTIKDLIDVSFLLLTSKSRVSRYPGYHCTVKKLQVAWCVTILDTPLTQPLLPCTNVGINRLAMVAFRQVLSKKQAAFGAVIAWLEREALRISSQKGMDCRPLLQAAKSSRGR